MFCTGVTTSICVQSTVRDAMFRHYLCVMLSDCMSEPIGHDLPRTNHEASLLNTEVLLGWVSDLGNSSTLFRGEHSASRSMNEPAVISRTRAEITFYNEAGLGFTRVIFALGAHRAGQRFIGISERVTRVRWPRFSRSLLRSPRLQPSLSQAHAIFPNVVSLATLARIISHLPPANRAIS